MPCSDDNVWRTHDSAVNSTQQEVIEPIAIPIAEAKTDAKLPVDVAGVSHTPVADVKSESSQSRPA